MCDPRRCIPPFVQARRGAGAARDGTFQQCPSPYIRCPSRTLVPIAVRGMGAARAFFRARRVTFINLCKAARIGSPTRPRRPIKSAAPQRRLAATCYWRRPLQGLSSAGGHAQRHRPSPFRSAVQAARACPLATSRTAPQHASRHRRSLEKSRAPATGKEAGDASHGGRPRPPCAAPLAPRPEIIQPAFLPHCHQRLPVLCGRRTDHAVCFSAAPPLDWQAPSHASIRV